MGGIQYVGKTFYQRRHKSTLPLPQAEAGQGHPKDHAEHTGTVSDSTGFLRDIDSFCHLFAFEDAAVKKKDGKMRLEGQAKTSSFLDPSAGTGGLSGQSFIFSVFSISC
ncbi:hypothetical protein ES708_27355 [subsurface metagenome]